MSLNPETLHGTHYTEEQFDAEVQKRYDAYVEDALSDEDDDFEEEEDGQSVRMNYIREVYMEWNPTLSMDDALKFEMTNSMKIYGTAQAGYSKEDNSNPLLEPIHGISLKDYTAIIMNLANFKEDELYAAFGIDSTVWQEVNNLWTKRMEQDTTFTVATLYGQYFAETSSHPTILKLKSSAGAPQATNEHLEKMRNDKYYYMELEAAREAAYEYGIDGAQWIQDHYGINLIDFQSVASNWMIERNKKMDTQQMLADENWKDEVKEKYKKQFASAQGGNVADDIEF